MQVIRIAGLMRSGSNLLTWMLRNNFSAVGTVTMLLGWKHGPIHRDKRQLTLDDLVDPRYRENIRNFVSKNPDRWLQLEKSDLYQAAKHQQAEQSYSVALAVRDPAAWYASCLRIDRERPEFLNHAVTPTAAASAWNSAHQHWLDHLGDSGTIVDTEALRTTPGPILEQIALDLGLHRRAEIKTPEAYIRPRSQEELYELLGMPVKNHYSARKFTRLREEDAEMRDAFIDLLDTDLLNRLGLDPVIGSSY